MIRICDPGLSVGELENLVHSLKEFFTESPKLILAEGTKLYRARAVQNNPSELAKIYNFPDQELGPPPFNSNGRLSPGGKNSPPVFYVSPSKETAIKETKAKENDIIFVAQFRLKFHVQLIDLTYDLRQNPFFQQHPNIETIQSIKILLHQMLTSSDEDYSLTQIVAKKLFDKFSDDTSEKCVGIKYKSKYVGHNIGLLGNRNLLSSGIKRSETEFPIPNDSGYVEFINFEEQYALAA